MSKPLDSQKRPRPKRGVRPQELAAGASELAEAGSYQEPQLTFLAHSEEFLFVPPTTGTAGP